MNKIILLIGAAISTLIALETVPDTLYYKMDKKSVIEDILEADMYLKYTESSIYLTYNGNYITYNKGDIIGTGMTVLCKKKKDGKEIVCTER